MAYMSVTKKKPIDNSPCTRRSRGNYFFNNALAEGKTYKIPSSGGKKRGPARPRGEKGYCARNHPPPCSRDSRKVDGRRKMTTRTYSAEPISSSRETLPLTGRGKPNYGFKVGVIERELFLRLWTSVEKRRAVSRAKNRTRSFFHWKGKRRPSPKSHTMRGGAATC